MTGDDFVALVGPVLHHVTAQANLPGITAQGILPAASLASQAGIRPDQITLRRDRSRVGQATLNHQRPLRAGASRAQDFLDGHTLQSWAKQLDERVFFWPSTRGAAFTDSLDLPTAVLTLDARRFFDAFHDRIDLSPINTGSATRRPAPRGDWIYVPATDSAKAFRNNRRDRGHVKSTDSVTEVSVRGAVTAPALQGVLT